MGSSRPWRPASQRDTIEQVVHLEVLPELFAQIERRQRLRAAAAREAETKTTMRRRLEALFNLPERTDDRWNHWQS